MKIKSYIIAGAIVLSSVGALYAKQNKNLSSAPSYSEPSTIATDQMGPVYAIQEVDAIEHIQAKLKIMQNTGELAKIEEQVKERMAYQMRNPKPVEGLSIVENSQSRYFDPTWVLDEDILDHMGNVLAKRGTKVNPLDVMPVKDKLFFFDGRDMAQVGMAKRLSEQYGLSFTPILTAGSWIDVSKALNRAVYFDQMGKMTSRLTIAHVPSLVYQEGSLMRIDEVKP